MDLSFTARNVLAGAAILGTVGGVLGCFTLLRRQSLLGDALAHAALPGVCLAFLLTGSKEPLPLFAGALVAGLAGSFAVLATVRWSRIKEDSAIGIVLSVFFGVGIVLLTHIQKLPAGNQSGLDRFLFGQAATLVERDVQLMAIVATVVLVLVVLAWKELGILAFDREFAASLGLPVRRVEALLTVLLVTVVVLGLQTVGVVLIVATLVTPAAAARQWTERLGTMVVISAAIGAGSGVVGALASASIPRLPTGPVIVLVASAMLVVSLLAAPERGLLQAWRRERHASRTIRRENLLKDLYRAGESPGGGAGRWEAPVAVHELMGERGRGPGELARLARGLAGDGLLDRSGDRLRLTPRGVAAAGDVVRRHRLWEVYLSRRLELAADHLHRDAEAMEHALTPEAAAELDRMLGHPRFDPHGQPIPRGGEEPGGADAADPDSSRPAP
ncbi:MAG TPA: iron chelate uptake ABC transporter family permease subunit [Thermoanaerobaculia bacterium]|nr:iron chelate uptake ABC transporter family permease subunit [Thermoanaerobaculia bacterium]